MVKEYSGENIADWDEFFDKYVNLVTSPSGEYTFESTPILIERLINVSAPKPDELVMDMGAGWGKVTTAIAPLVKKVIAVEPAKKNIAASIEEVRKRGLTNVEFVRGEFLHPGTSEQVDLFISSAAFHHVIEKDKGWAIAVMHNLLKKNGRVVISDPFFFFDPEEYPERFNRIYRYLTPKTLPEQIYKSYIEPHFISNPEYVYTWKDMKRYTPKEGQYYKLSDLTSLFENQGFEIIQSDELAPFFGIICAQK